ncbi:MAG: hypothetical protein ABFR50_04045 [Candidatus Fermentibacteria bacterium]
MFLNSTAAGIRALIIACIFVALSGNPSSASDMDIEALGHLGLRPFPEKDSLSQETYTEDLLSCIPLSAEDIDSEFTNIEDLTWLESIAADNKCVLLGESHYFRYVANLQNRIIFALNTYDYYPLVVLERQYSLTPFINHYLDLEQDSLAREYYDAVLSHLINTVELQTRVEHLRRWNQRNPGKPVHFGFSDIEHDYRTTISTILLPYLRQAEPDLEIDTGNLIPMDLGDVVSELRRVSDSARQAGTVGAYPFITPDYIDNVIDNLESTYFAKLDGGFSYYRQKAIIRNLTDPRFLGNYLIDGKAVIIAGGYHTATGFEYPEGGNFFKEGSYLNYDFEPTQGRTYSIYTGAFAYSLDAMADIDPSICGHHGSGYMRIVGNLRQAYQDSLISPDDNMLYYTELNDFTRLLLSKASEFDFEPVLFTEMDMDGLLESAESAEREDYMNFRYYSSTVDVHDQYILVPYSPVTTAIPENTD